MNERLIQLLPRGQFATMFYGIIDLARDELRYASAGSPHPVVLRTDAEAQMLDGTGRPLGIAPHTYPTRTAAFAAGARVCFYSDALTETVDIDGAYIDEAQVAALLTQGTWSAETALLQLLDHYDTRTLPRNRRDDLTIGLICRHGAKRRAA
jgi:sigma-B regulation protein RsbU (phosphoserine phosphatase)